MLITASCSPQTKEASPKSSCKVFKPIYVNMDEVKLMPILRGYPDFTGKIAKHNQVWEKICLPK